MIVSTYAAMSIHSFNLSLSQLHQHNNQANITGQQGSDEKMNFYMSSCKKIHLTLLLYLLHWVVYSSYQSIEAFLRYVGLELCAWFLLDWAEVPCHKKQKLHHQCKMGTCSNNSGVGLVIILWFCKLSISNCFILVLLSVIYLYNITTSLKSEPKPDR